jgi:hypothetical protein
MAASCYGSFTLAVAECFDRARCVSARPIHGPQEWTAPQPRVHRLPLAEATGAAEQAGLARKDELRPFPHRLILELPRWEAPDASG